jgi:hypothetical protein
MAVGALPSTINFPVFVKFAVKTSLLTTPITDFGDLL